MPRFSADDYVDFCVAEATVQKANREQKELAQEKERAEWRSPEATKQWAAENGLTP